MALQTEIEYADSTVNGQMGCDGCELWNGRNKSCYAGRMTETYKGQKGWPASFTRPEIFPGRIEQAAKWADLTGTQRPYKPWLDFYPRIIFLNDMGDTFTKSLPLDWLLPYIPIIENSRHIWLILTKNGSRMVKFFNEVLGYVPPNVWPGVTITGQRTITRLDFLLQLPATAIRWISVEPYLAPIRFPDDTFDLVDWLAVGGASGPDAPPLLPNSVRELRDLCMGRASFFFKQWGEYKPVEAGGDVCFERLGKTEAGRWLDGRIWSQLPKYKPTGQMVLL